MDPALAELLVGAADEELEVVLRLRGTAVPPQVRVVARFGPVVTGRVARGALREVWAHPETVSIKAPRLLTLEDEAPLEGPLLSVEPVPTDQRRPEGLPETGRGVVIGVVDVGADFAHPHFRRADGATRLLALWDQRPPASAAAQPNVYGYGRIYTAAEINRALAAADPYAALGYHPAAADPLGIGAHGTLVLDIAAGNGALPGSPPGLAPEADLIFVHVATEALPGLANLGDSVRLLEALDFIRRTAGSRPWIGHLSLGRRGGPHDGLSLVEQALDHLVQEAPGRAVVMSCGNYFASRAHASGRLQSGRSQTFTWLTDRADVTPNELEVWYPGRDVLRVELRPPAGEPVFRAALGENVPIVIQSAKVGHLYHRAHDPNNGDHHIDIFLQPEAPAGAWQVTLHGEAVVDGRVHLWVERDAPCSHCDSRFRDEEADPCSTIGTICNGFYTIAVGAYDAHAPEWRLAPFSSAGPTRDGRQKPDLVAPGVNILGARSAPLQGWQGNLSQLTRQSGTSFAAPHVTGTLALMFQAAGQLLDIHTTRRLLLAAAREVAVDPEERTRLGSGLLDVSRAVAAARELAPGGQHMDRPFVTPAGSEAEPAPETFEAWEEDRWPEEEERETYFPETAEDGEGNSPLFGILRIANDNFEIAPASAQPERVSANLDELLQYALQHIRSHAVITGNLLTAQEFRLFAWGNQTISFPPPVVEVQATEELAAILLNEGRTAYFPSNPVSSVGLQRWVEIPRLRGFYALAAEDQQSQRQAWIDRILQVRNQIRIPNVAVNRSWLDGRAMPALRSILAHWAAAVFPVQDIDRPEKNYRGVWVRGLTLPLLTLPITEPECYLPVIAGVEGRLEAINAYDLGAGISLGPIQFNVIRGALFRFLAELRRQDNHLFQQELAGPLDWSVMPHEDHFDLLIRGGTSQEIRLHGRRERADVRRNYAYFQSGDPAQPNFNQIDTGWRRTVATRFRNVVVWPHVQELIIRVSAWWLEDGLHPIHEHGIPPLDPHQPVEDTFILKSLLLSAFVRFSSSLQPILRALKPWNKVTEKLRHWREALHSSGWSTPAHREHLLSRLNRQENHARAVFATIRRLLAAPTTATAARATATAPQEREPFLFELSPTSEFREEQRTWENEPKEPQTLTVDLVKLAETLSAGGNLRPEAWLAQLLLKASGDMAESSPELTAALRPEDLFLALARGRRLNRFPYDRYFHVLGAPGQPLRVQVQAGDLLIRIAPGEPGLGHAAMNVSRQLVPWQSLPAQGLRGEGRLPGWYIQVIEPGPFPRCRSHGFARRLLDAQGRLLPYQVLLRLTPEKTAAELEEQAAAQVPLCQLEGTESYQVNWWDGPESLRFLEDTAPPELVDLLRYLQVSYPTFAPHEGRYFEALTQHLRRHGVLAANDTVNRQNFREVVRDFQGRHNLGSDGLPGEGTLWELQHDWALTRRLQVIRVAADKVAGSDGYDHFWLREDAARAYERLRQEVLARGGIITSAGGFRELGAAITPGRSRTSMHYSGLALDMATDTGMHNPRKDPYLITRDGAKWRVWCRSDQAAEIELKVVVWSNGRIRQEQIHARAFDFTNLANRHGFANIGPRRSFPQDYLSAEWWHFQYNEALTPFISQLGIELLSLRVYNETSLARHTDIWAHRKRIFQRGSGLGWY